MVQLSSFNELIKKQNKLYRKRFGKKIAGKLVNQRLEIANVYSVSNFGVVRNNKTGKTLSVRTDGKIWLKNVYGSRCQYSIPHLVYSAFNNVSTYKKKVFKRNPYNLCLENLYM